MAVNMTERDSGIDKSDLSDLGMVKVTETVIAKVALSEAVTET